MQKKCLNWWFFYRLKFSLAKKLITFFLRNRSSKVQGVNYSLKISGNPYDKICQARNPFQKREISYAKCWSDLFLAKINNGLTAPLECFMVIETYCPLWNALWWLKLPLPSTNCFSSFSPWSVRWILLLVPALITSPVYTVTV